MTQKEVDQAKELLLENFMFGRYERASLSEIVQEVIDAIAILDGAVPNKAEEKA